MTIKASDPDNPNARYHETVSKNTLLKLDKILEYVCHDMPPVKTALEISDFILKKYDIDLGETNTISALLKLEKEGYVKVDIRDSKPNRYMATFDGAILNDMGGYTQKVKLEKEKDNIKEINDGKLLNLQKILVWATVALAFGVLLDVLKFLLDYIL